MNSAQLRSLAQRVEQRQLSDTDVLYLQRMLLREAQSREANSREAFTMNLDDVVVHYVENGEMWVFATFGGYNKNWPKYLTHDGCEYVYAHNEFMPQQAVGKYSGYAKYTARRWSV